MVNKGVLIFAVSFLICACSGDVTLPNAATLSNSIQNEQSSDLNIKEIGIGKALSLDQIKDISILDDEFKKLHDVECGGFFSMEESQEEAVYLYGNMAVNIAGSRGAIMQIVGIPANTKIKYNDLLIDYDFRPKNLSTEKFEVSVYKAMTSDNITGIESIDIETVYDTMYSIRERINDDLLYLYFSDNKLVAIKVLAQC